jgi:hypothetical protein
MKSIKLILVILVLATITLTQGFKNPTPGLSSSDSSPSDILRGMYPFHLPGNGSLEMQTNVDLLSTMKLGGDNLIANLDPANNYLPSWSVLLMLNDSLDIRYSYFSHNMGRWWDAMLRLENATGYHIPANIEAAMLENLKKYFDNPESLCLEPNLYSNKKLWIDLHSLREGMLALNALVRYRNNSWAKEKGHAMCLSLLRLTKEDGSLDIEKLSGYRGYEGYATYPRIRSDGRLIEALVWFYEATGDSAAILAADRFARYHLKNSTLSDGSAPFEIGSHTHSYLGTLRGLLLFGELTDQKEYIDAVVKTYEKTFKVLLKKSGFISHNFATDSVGETSSPGDIAQIALWLATRHERTEYFDEVERIVRARLIPCQITDVPELKNPKYAPLLLGALGGMYKDPHGFKEATTDVTAAVIHTLVDVYSHIVVSEEAGLRVNMHLNYEDNKIRIASKREKSAMLSVSVKEKQNVNIRIPRWTPMNSVKITVDGKLYQPLVLGNYIFVPKELLPGEIVVSYALPVSTEIEATKGITYRITWRGDEVMGIWPNSSHLPFYPDFIYYRKQ